MKKHYILIFLLIFLSLDMLSSQVYKTVYVAVPGTLVDINDLYTVTHLTVTGTLDKRDFETLNTLDLVSLDLSGVSIAAYDETQNDGSVLHYLANVLPPGALLKPYGNNSLITLVLPDNLTGIGNSSLASFNVLQSLTLPATLRYIDDSAFSGTAFNTVDLSACALLDSIGNGAFNPCPNLININLASCLNLKKIKEGAFSSCPFNAVAFPASLTYLGVSSFSQCRNLSTVDFSRCTALKRIETWSFGDSPEIKDIDLSACNSLDSVRNSAFHGCSGLTSVKFPASLQDIGEEAFWNDTLLASVDFNLCNQLKTIGKNSFFSCQSIEKLDLSNCEQLDSIALDAFIQCYGIREINLPPNLRYVGAYAFINADSLKIVSIKNPIPPIYEYWAFPIPDVENLPVLYVPSGSKNAYSQSAWRSFSYIVEDTGGVLAKSIKTSANRNINVILTQYEKENITHLKVKGDIDARDFVTLRDAMPALTELDISDAIILAYTGTEGTAPDDAAMVPARIKKQGRHIVSEGTETVAESAARAVKAVDVTYPANEIPEDAFYSYVNDGKASLTSITLPATLGSIGREAFLNTGLTAVTLPETVTSIGDWAFQGTSLQTITLPASVINLGVNCFFDITTLQSISVDALNTAYASAGGVLFNKNKSRIITYPAGKTLSAYTLPEGVEWIDFGAFYGNEYLTTVQLPSALNGIGNGAFSGCYNLNSINFPSSLQYIGDGAFVSTNISNVDLSACNSLTTISGWAFQNSSISNLSLPASITTIGQYAFSICNNLTQVDWSGNTNLGTLEDYVFWRCDNLNSVKLPRSVNAIGYGNFLSCYKLTDISVAPDNPYFAATDAVLMNKDYTSLIAYAPGKIANKYVVPATVTAIKDAAFRDCPYLTSIDAQNSHLVSIGLSAFNGTPLTEITLPGTVTFIANYAFRYCSELSTFKIYNPVPPALGTNVFQYASTSSCKLYVPKGAKASYAAADQWNSFANTEEFIIDGVENPDMPGLIISQQGGLLRISGVAVGETLRIYGLSGQLIASRKAETAIVDISLPEKGVYVLQVGTNNRRIIFK